MNMFSMNVSTEEEIKKEIAETVKPLDDEKIKLKEIADNNTAEIMNSDIDSMEKRKAIVQSIEQFGLDTIRKSSQKNALLRAPVGNLSKMGGEEGAISKGLLDLQREVKDLDPGALDFTKSGLLGKLFNPVRNYFAKYQKSETVINDIIESLELGKKTLLNDNTTLELEEQSLRDLTKKLNKEIELGVLMDRSVSEQISAAEAAGENKDKITFVTEEILFPMRQRIMDMQQMSVVNQQGIIAIEVIRRNNKELIRGVERAKTVTISALRIAVIVASALYNQKIVLKKIKALNETTNTLVENTSRMLKEQGAEIHKQAMETSISPETLKNAFADVISALDEISTYKKEALPLMKTTIEQFKELAADGEKRIEKLEKGNLLNG